MQNNGRGGGDGEAATAAVATTKLLDEGRRKVPIQALIGNSSISAFAPSIST